MKFIILVVAVVMNLIGQTGFETKINIQFKLWTVFLLILFDIYINSTENDNIILQTPEKNHNRILLFGTQIFLQITMFSVLFLSSCETYLFQVGLIGILVHEFSFTIFFCGLYFFISIIAGMLQIVSFFSFLINFVLKHEVMILDD